MVTKARDLEDLAKSIRRRTKGLRADVQAQIDSEIGMLSDRIDQLRHSKECHRRQLLREECRIDTDLLSLKSYNPLIYAHSEKTREQLKGRRQRVKKDMRSLERSIEMDIFTIHDRLFDLLQQRTWLDQEAE